MATQASDSIKQKPRITTADELAVVVQRAQAFTNATGAAIAIGTSEELVCRARSGSSAPDVGTSLRVEGSFTGICIQTGKELRCDDAETDTRVDTTAIRALGIRSMVVTPIKDEGKVVGVLAVFAPTPHAFTITHVAVLKTMADQIVAVLQRERRPREDSHHEPLMAVPKTAVAATPLPPVVIRPSGATVAAAPARTNGSAAPAIEPARPVAIAPEVIHPIPFPKKEEKREPKHVDHRPESSPASKSSFAVLDAVAGEQHKAKGNKFLLTGLLAVVIIASGVVWMFARTHKSSPAAPPQAVQQPPQNSTPAVQPSAAVTSNQPATTVPTAAPAPSLTVVPDTSKTNASNKSESKKSEPSAKNEKPNKPAAVPAPTPTTVALESGPSRIAQPASAEQTSTPDAAVAPSLSVGNASSSELNSLARPVSSPAPAMVTQSDLVNAHAIRTVPAVYPEIAKIRRISGTVVVRVTVGKDGKVNNPKFISGPIIFRDSAFEAVQKWVFKPATLNGVPIEQDTEIKVLFHPAN